MNLFIHTQSVNRDMKITASNGKQYYLVDVIAHILKYLKDKLISLLRHGGHPLETTDFDWVITVPAIWRARGKQMMREAGYKVRFTRAQKTECTAHLSTLTISMTTAASGIIPNCSGSLYSYMHAFSPCKSASLTLKSAGIRSRLPALAPIIEISLS